MSDPPVSYYITLLELWFQRVVVCRLFHDTMKMPDGHSWCRTCFPEDDE